MYLGSSVFMAAHVASSKKKISRSRALAATGTLGVALLCASCAVGPNYKRPEVVTTPEFKEAAGWKKAEPSDAKTRGAWWEIYNDPILNELEKKVELANQTLKQAAASYEQARQLARADHATWFPTVTAQGAVERSRSRVQGVNNAYSASGGATWDLDLWGRIRRTVEADVASAEASAADFASAKLSLQLELAQNYFQLRASDERKRLYEEAVKGYQRFYDIAKNKYTAGISTRSDILSAQTQVDTARAQALDVTLQRAQYEHAIAVLTGEPPALLSIQPWTEYKAASPFVPTDIPTAILERRPDIAAAERAVVAANASIGVRTAAYFPDLSLSGSLGYQSGAWRQLFDAPNRIWSLGGSIAESVFDAGERRALVLRARAAYDASVASYRQTVLTSFQEVEDALSQIRILAEESEMRDQTVKDATEAARIALNEYRAGTVDYTTVVNAQITELTSRQNALTVVQNRLIASASLIRSLGGSWTQSDLPSRSDVLARNPKTAQAAK
jgi:NodT family efflux transporter outer membrane factor (OMF) lipoprotein